MNLREIWIRTTKKNCTGCFQLREHTQNHSCFRPVVGLAERPHSHARRPYCVTWKFRFKSAFTSSAMQLTTTASCWGPGYRPGRRRSQRTTEPLRNCCSTDCPGRECGLWVPALMMAGVLSRPVSCFGYRRAVGIRGKESRSLLADASIVEETSGNNIFFGPYDWSLPTRLTFVPWNLNRTPRGGIPEVAA